MNSYLHVLSGSQSGSSLALESGILYHAANNFESDIYIKCGLDDDQVELSFSVIQQVVRFKKIFGDITSNNQEIAADDEYPLPFICNMAGVDVIFTFEADYDIAYDYYNAKEVMNLQNLEEITDEDEEYLDNVKDFKQIDEEFPDDLTALEQIDQNYSGDVKRVEDIFASELDNSITDSKKKNIAFKVFKRCLDKCRLICSGVSKTVYSIIFCCLLVFSGLLVLVLQYNKQSNLMEIHGQQFKLNTDLKSKLSLLPREYSYLTYSSEGNKSIVSGVVPKHSDLVNVKSVVNKLDSNMILRVWAFEDIAPQLLTILKQYNINRANVRFNNENAVIEFSGMTSSLDKLDNAEIAIDNKFKGIGEIDVTHVFLISAMEKDLQNIINQNDYKQKLTIDKKYEEGNITLEGYLSKDELNKLQLQADIFNQKYSPVIKVVASIQNSILALPFRIDSIYTGAEPWIVTEDGQRIYVGGLYKGVSLVSIDDEKIVFKKNSLLTINLDQVINYKGG